LIYMEANGTCPFLYYCIKSFNPEWP